jgi:uncharacterized membrane protein YgcG
LWVVVMMVEPAVVLLACQLLVSISHTHSTTSYITITFPIILSDHHNKNKKKSCLSLPTNIKHIKKVREMTPKLIHRRKLLALRSKFKSLEETLEDSGGLPSNDFNGYNRPLPNHSKASDSSNGSGGGGGGGGSGATDGGGSSGGGGSGNHNLPVRLGLGGTAELTDFLKCFQPLAESSERGKAKRKTAFSTADPNGNGLCSLAELEGFVLKTLLAAFPKDKKGRGKDNVGGGGSSSLAKGRGVRGSQGGGGGGDGEEVRGRVLFDAFRPCYLRAFSDAKDYKADLGKVISGTKAATADDFVSKGEFRFFCAYLCIYAAMVS